MLLRDFQEESGRYRPEAGAAAPRVLVVDDTEAQRYAAAHTLRQAGCVVVEAASGSEALAVAQRHEFDAVVLDVRLPDISGIEVCQRLKSGSASMLPVLLLSAYETSLDARASGLDAGADGYLVQPFNPEELRALVGALVRLRRNELARANDLAANALLQDALDALADHVALIDERGDVVAVNTAWERFARENGHHDGTAGLGRNYLEVCERAGGPGGHEARQAAEGIRRVLSGELRSFELTYPCHAPTAERWFHMVARSVPRRARSAVAAVITHTNRTAETVAARRAEAERERAEAEHTARERDEALFRALTEQSVEFVAILEPDGMFRYVSPSARRALGYEPGDLVGQSAFELLQEDQVASVRDALAALVDSGSGAARDVFALLRRKDGAWRYFEGAVVNLLDHSAVGGITCNVRDVTPRVEAERAQRLVEARFRGFVETSREILWAIDARGRTTYVNPRVESISGYRAEALVGRDLTELVSWNAAATIREALAQHQAIDQLETMLRHADGGHVAVLLSSNPLPASDSGGAIVTLTDITERQAVAAERERLVRMLEVERTRLATVFRRAPSFIVVLKGPDHVVERVNEAYRDLIGPRDVVGKPLAEALPEVLSQPFVGIIEHVRATGEVIRNRAVPARLVRSADGTLETRYVDVTYQRLPDPDGVDRVVVHGIDITEQVLAVAALRETESRLREQFAKLPVATFLLETRGEDFALVDLNEAADELIAPIGRGAIGGLATRLFPDEWNVRGDCARSLGESVVLHRSVHLPAATGNEERTFELTIGPQPPDRVLLHASETTEKTRLSNQLRQAQKMEAIGQLAGGIAHDFNNLLTVIGAHCAFLLDSLPAESPSHDDASSIRDAADRAATLTRQLLAFSRKQMLRPSIIDLNVVVEAAYRMLDRVLGEDINIVLQMEEMPQPILVDPGQVEQVLMNLAVNGRDAMPDGGRLTIATRAVHVAADAKLPDFVPEGDYAVLSVSDTGFGMDAETRAKAFEPFFTTKEPGKGTGLGLSTVYGIVKQSNGYVHLTSAPGLGTTFDVYFPIVGDAATRTPISTPASPPPRRATVLLVEDDPAVRGIALRVLHREGYAVIEATNGPSAIALAEAHPGPIDLVITDAVMPGMNGAVVLSALRAARPEIGALLMSGYTGDEMTRLGINVPDVEFLQKPFTPSELAQYVRRLLEESVGAL